MRTHTPDEVDPIWVRCVEGGFEIVYGEHRWKAAKAIGWSKLRAFVLDISEDEAKAFNVRKNRERGRIDAIKFGKILYEEHQKGATLKELAKKYGYAHVDKISNYISVYKNGQLIYEALDLSQGINKPISFRRALRVLRELRRRDREVETEADLEVLALKQGVQLLSREVEGEGTADKEKTQAKTIFTWKE